MGGWQQLPLLQRLHVKLGRLLAVYGIFKRSNEDATQFTSQQRHTSLQPCTGGEEEAKHFSLSLSSIPTTSNVDGCVVAPCKPEKHVINSSAVLYSTVCRVRNVACMEERHYSALMGCWTLGPSLTHGRTTPTVRP
jgi:hypothetical protein